MSLEIGSIVVSLKGRDCQRQFCVVGLEGKYALLCDGKLHRLEKPKHKNLKHLKLTSHHLQPESLQVNKHIYKALNSLMNFQEE